MGKYLDKVKHLQPEQRTDKTDRLPESVSVSGMSGPFPKSPGENSSPQPTAPVVIEPAHPHARPIFWERNDGRIYGPAAPEFLAQVGLGLKTTDFWVVADFETQSVWIRSDRLRSRKAFEQQPEVREVKRIPGGLFRNGE